LILVAAVLFDALPAALSGLIFLGWAIPAITQGVAKWLSTRREMISILKDRSGVKGGREPERSLPSAVATTGELGFAGSVTEGTTASLNRQG
jgi:hypothetical protein